MPVRMHHRRAVMATTAAVAALASTAAIAAPGAAPKRTPDPVPQARVRPATPEPVRPLPSMEPIPQDVAAAGARDVAEAPSPEPTPEATAATGRTVWDDLADCESGDWNANGVPIPGTARWNYGLTFDHGDIFEGGVNFHPQTWDAYKGAGMPDHAGQATRAQQIAAAERVLADQGWGAWPVCSRKLGLR